MKRILPLALMGALVAAVVAGQSQADANKAQQEKKAKQDAKQAKQAARAPAAQRNLEPPEPVLAWIYPAGGERGRTVELTAAGTAILAQSVLVSGTGVTAEVVEAKDPTQARVRVTIAADALPGVRELRILTAGGVSNRARFVVGDQPEILEVEPNSDKAHPQKIVSLPVLVNGQILEGDRDYFQFHARAGETIVCQVDARSLLPYIADAVPGWFDAVLAVYDASGKQLAYADDNRFNPDPLLEFRAPVDGDYTLEIRDVIYRGRGDFVYRLTIGGPAPGPVSPPLPATDLPVVGEREPNGSREQAQPVTVPVAIEGRIRKPGGSAYYRFHERKGDKLVMEVEARRYGSPLDSILTLYNARNEVLAENDDWSDPLAGMTAHQADSRLVYTFTADADYFLRIRDVQAKGGEEYSYRLKIAPPRPDFVLRITPDNPRLAQGDTAAIAVTAVRRDEFDGEIRLDVEGLPSGFITSEALIAAGQNEGRLTITAPPEAALGILSPQVVGTATIGKDTVMRRAQAAEAVMQAFAYTHVLPTSRLMMVVIPQSAYTLSTDVGPGKALEVAPESETPIVVKVQRREGVKGMVTIQPVRLANNAIVIRAAQVPADKDEVTVTLTVAKEAKPGLRQDVILSGILRAGTQSITRFAQAIPVRVAAR